MIRRIRRGFTLLELMIVMGILVLLAGLVLPNLIGATQKANVKLAQVAVANNGPIANALKQYCVDMQAYPTTEQGLAALWTKPTDEAQAAKWTKPYLESDKLVDPWGTPFQYTCPGDHNVDGYDLSSAGPDKQHGNEDDLCNWSTDTGAGTGK